MQPSSARTGLQLRSLVKRTGDLELSLTSVPIPTPAANEVLIRVEAAPINPSDLGLLFAGADLSQMSQRGTTEHPVVAARIPDAMLKSLAARFDVSMPVGNEGAGVVVEAGSSAAAQALLGKTVAALGGAMYSQYRCVSPEQCLALPDGATPADGASSFVNPLTALGMVETMRAEGHVAIVHTAAASNLGQMLVRVCLEERIPLVNVVRKPEQAGLLRDLGAQYVVDTSAPSFFKDLADAVAATKATIAFDAIGGGELGSQILTAMEIVASRGMAAYNRYGSSTLKQLYIYGALDTSPTKLTRSYGFAWSVGGFLVTSFVEKIAPKRAAELRARIAAGLKTTFASQYSQTISLAEALDLGTMSRYLKRETGQKYLIEPNRGLSAGG
jgi:NADPH:quinone reductase